ncbi:MAG TPA: serine hydrolase domain-containing protein [Longimicrobiales bacterium]|nr:serine hydrolase domain-containing protein [Longimicrobiales bacterium]
MTFAFRRRTRSAPAAASVRVAAMLALVAFAPSLSAQTLGDRFLGAAVDSVVAAHMESGPVAGLTVAVARGGTLLHHKAYGHADLELDVGTPLDAVYEIGSVTKQFTAVLVLQLADEGVLELDEDFRTYFPDFDTGGRAVPLRRLLDHTSGMKGYTEMRSFGSLAAAALPQDSLLRLVEAEPWEFEPGEGLIYNNSAYFLLGRLLEKVTGESYETLVEERLFGPLGMEGSRYCSNSEVVPNRAHGYQAARDGFQRAPYLDHRWPYAAGSLCSTARDLVRWNQALHGGEVLSPEMYTLLITPEPLNDGTPVRYAKGLVHQESAFGEVIEHGGGIFGFLSDVKYYPDEELVVVALQNTAGPAGPGTVVTGVVELLRERREPDAQPYPGDLQALVARYAGAARGMPMNVGISVEGDSLRVQLGDGDPQPIPYLGGGVFGGFNTRIWFLDAQGRRVGTPGAGAPVELRFDGASAHYVLKREEG